MKDIIPLEKIEQKIYLIRRHKVILDKDLARLYGVPTKRLNEQVKRNFSRFPDDFMFQLNKQEYNDLKSHFATSRWGGTRKLPYVFTEQGVAISIRKIPSPLGGEGKACPERSRKGEGDVERSQRP